MKKKKTFLLRLETEQYLLSNAREGIWALDSRETYQKIFKKMASFIKKQQIKFEVLIKNFSIATINYAIAY